MDIVKIENPNFNVNKIDFFARSSPYTHMFVYTPKTSFIVRGFNHMVSDYMLKYDKAIVFCIYYTGSEKKPLSKWLLYKNGKPLYNIIFSRKGNKWIVTTGAPFKILHEFRRIPRRWISLYDSWIDTHGE